MALQVDKVTCNLYYLRCCRLCGKQNYIFRNQKEQFGEKLKLEVRIMSCWSIFYQIVIFVPTIMFVFFLEGHFHAPLCLRFGVPLAHTTNQRVIFFAEFPFHRFHSQPQNSFSTDFHRFLENLKLFTMFFFCVVFFGVFQFFLALPRTIHHLSIAATLKELPPGAAG